MAQTVILRHISDLGDIERYKKLVPSPARDRA